MIVFQSTRIEKIPDHHWQVRDLTLHGTTRKVFGITYAGFAVGSEVAFTIDTVGTMSEATAKSTHELRASRDDRAGP